MTTATLSKVLRILRREIKKWKVPAVGVIAEHAIDRPFETLVSTILSLRTKDAVTEAASRRLLSHASTPEAIAALPIRKIERLIYPVGFYHTKARNLKRTCALLLEQHADTLQAAKTLSALRSAAEEVRQFLPSHFAHEEHPGGLYDSMEFCFPQHRQELAQLIQDHRDLTAAAWQLCQRARDPKPRLPTLRKEAAQLIKKLHLHERLEHEIAHPPLSKGPAHRA